MKILTFILVLVLCSGCSRRLEQRIAREVGASSVEDYEIGDYPFEAYTERSISFLRMFADRDGDNREVLEARLRAGQTWDETKRIEWAEFLSLVTVGDRVLIVRFHERHPRTEFVGIYRGGVEVQRFWLRGNGGMQFTE